ncbi:Spherulation-specific family 4-domain-containing protein [Mycena galopus ATCC 62051]|nr:Spherulation-specific family 4-domain-containing protein [Mycena galopus ATCC 62051]
MRRLTLPNAQILLPLYIYPGASCSAWSPASEAISANSNAQWYIILNPESGPGPKDEFYETCVSQIPASANQVTMGFINANGGNVLGDIDTYAGWPNTSRPHGIFFDDISPTVNQLSTYQSYVSHAQSKGFTFVSPSLFSKSTVTDSSYFSMADLINTYEGSYSAFNPDALSGNLSQQSVTLVNSSATGSYSTVISQLKTLGVAAVYITNVPDSSEDLPIQLSEFASEVASVGGVRHILRYKMNKLTRMLLGDSFLQSRRFLRGRHFLRGRRFLRGHRFLRDHHFLRGHRFP